MRITEMSMDDYDEVYALWKASEGIGLSSADGPEAIARYLARNPRMSFVAREESGPTGGQPGPVIGAALCGHDGRRGYLHHLAVRPDCRGQGLGSALVERCVQALAAEGIDKCHLFVYKLNEGGRAFWSKTGWSERVTLVLMSKDIESPVGTRGCGGRAATGDC
jgi:putative acetyltransferase